MQDFAGNVRESIGRLQPCCRIWNNADCWMKHLSSGAPSSGGRPQLKMVMAEIIIRLPSVSGWPVAEFAVD